MNASKSTQLDLSIQSSAQHWIEQTTTDIMIRGWVQLANIGFVQSNFAEHVKTKSPSGWLQAAMSVRWITLSLNQGRFSLLHRFCAHR